jgi:hypothetical protein
MLETLTTVLHGVILPQKPAFAEQMTAMLLQSVLDDPTKGAKVLDKLAPFIELGNRMQSQQTPAEATAAPEHCST